MNINCIYYKEVDSTNNALRRRLDGKEPPEEYTVISAGTQTAGRGRSGHEWASPPDVSIATSMVLYPKELPDECVPMLTIVAAEAVAKAVEDICGLETQIKWPNDILLSEKKICGILTEHIGNAVIVGIGVNMYPGSYPTELSGQAACIAEELTKFIGKAGKSPEDRRANRRSESPIVLSRKVLTEAIWENFRVRYQQFLREKDLAFLQETYNRRLINAGRTVKIMEPGNEYEARALEMDTKGRLVVEQLKTGERRCIDAGEVHVRGRGGYV